MILSHVALLRPGRATAILAGIEMGLDSFVVEVSEIGRRKSEATNLTMEPSAAGC